VFKPFSSTHGNGVISVELHLVVGSSFRPCTGKAATQPSGEKLVANASHDHELVHLADRHTERGNIRAIESPGDPCISNRYAVTGNKNPVNAVFSSTDVVARRMTRLS